MAPSRPSLIPEYTAGPTPGRVLPNTTPTIVVHDAGMVSECHKIWPIKSHDNQYARYEAFSPKGGVPTIFTTSHREWEALDWLKNFAGLSTNTDSWARGTRGKGVVKQYEHMRSVAYLYQAMMVSASELRAGNTGGHQDDICQVPAKNPICPAMDEERNDLRLGAIYACILAMLARYPNAQILVFLRGDRIVGRYNDLVGISGSLADLIQNAAFSVVLGTDTSDYLTTMDQHLVVTSVPPANATQPDRHPNINVPTHFELTDLKKDPKSKQWKINPESLPLFPTPLNIQPRPRTILRVMCDTNEHSRHHHQYVNLVKLFIGSISFSAVSEVYRELKDGTDPNAAQERRTYFKDLMKLAKTELFKAKYGSRTWYYGADQSPKPVKPPKGDLRIRLQIAEVIEELERSFPGDEVVIVFVTNDYNMEMSLGALMPARATFLCLRTEGGEHGNKLADVVSSVLKPWLV